MKSTTFEDFISKSNDKHENKYDYSLIKKDDIETNFNIIFSILLKVDF